MPIEVKVKFTCDIEGCSNTVNIWCKSRERTLPTGWHYARKNSEDTGYGYAICNSCWVDESDNYTELFYELIRLML